MMRGVAPAANYVRAERNPASTDNPFLAMQQQFSKTMVDTLNLYVTCERNWHSFHAVYGSPLVQAACGISANDSPPRPRPGMLPFVLAAARKRNFV